jgi:very-short-patch-repair endonuclease
MPFWPVMLRRRGKFHVRDNPLKTYRRKTETEIRLQAQDARARQLESPTLAGQAFAGILKQLGVEFEAECILYRPGGFCIVDFVSRPLGIGFEIDGRYHQRQRNYDQGKDLHAAEQGIKIYRITNEAVLTKPRDTIARIREILATHQPKELSHGPICE